MNGLPDQLLAVTDRHLSIRPILEQVAEILSGGARWIWLRDRDLPREERRRLAFQVRELTSLHGASLTIGADVELARETAATGVQLARPETVVQARQALGAGRLLGVSCHSLSDVAAAAQAGADYVTLSPIFTSASKPGYGPALGTGAVAVAAEFPIGIIALGGVTPETARACISAGCAGVATMGPLMACIRPSLLINEFRDAIASDGHR